MRVIELMRYEPVLGRRVFSVRNAPDDFTGGPVVPLEDVKKLKKLSRALSKMVIANHSGQCVCEKCILAQTILNFIKKEPKP